MIAQTQVLLAGEELAYSYGLAYWETFADQVLDIEYSEKQQQEIKQQQHDIRELKNAVEELMEKVKELEFKRKKKKRVVVEPLNNGKRTPSTTPVPALPSVAAAEVDTLSKSTQYMYPSRLRSGASRQVPGRQGNIIQGVADFQ